MKGKYFLNIKSGVIHNGEAPCYAGKHMDEGNKKWSDLFERLENYYDSGGKKGVACERCCRRKK